MTTNTATAYQQIVSKLVEEGWVPGSPSLIAETIDRDVCAVSLCQTCDKVGLCFHPWKHVEQHRYRCYAVCPVCNAVDQF